MEKPASSPGGTAVETDPCAHAAASGGRTLPAGSCGKGQGGKSFMAPARGSDKAPPLMGCGVPLSRAHLHHLPVPLLNPHTCGFSPCRSVRIWYYMDLWLKLPTGSWPSPELPAHSLPGHSLQEAPDTLLKPGMVCPGLSPPSAPCPSSFPAEVGPSVPFHTWLHLRSH